MTDAAQLNKSAQQKPSKLDYVYAVGRRRESVARVRLYEHVKDGLAWKETKIKKGDILVNEQLISEIFPTSIMRYIYSEPFRVTNTANKYTITIQVSGGGRMGQLKAVVHGIAQALAEVDGQKHHVILRAKGFLTRDPRVRQRRNVGTGGKARRTKQSPKR